MSAYAVDLDKLEWNDDRLPSKIDYGVDELVRNLKAICGDLIQVSPRADEEVLRLEFIHPSVAEYLQIRGIGLWAEQRNGGIFSTRFDAHQTIICISIVCIRHTVEDWPNKGISPQFSSHI